MESPGAEMNIFIYMGFKKQTNLENEESNRTIWSIFTTAKQSLQKKDKS